MKTEELKSSLKSVQDVLAMGADVFPNKGIQEITDVITNIDENSIMVMSALLKTEPEKLKDVLPKLGKAVNTLQTFFESGKNKSISESIDSLLGRPFVLATIAKLL